MSIRARGYCPAQSNGTGIVLQVFNATVRHGTIIFNTSNITAECNTTAIIDSSYYEGYVSIDDLDIIIPPEGLFSIRYDPNCSCFFQPLLINTTGKHDWYYFNEKLDGKQLGLSPSLSAKIIVEGKYNMY